MFPLALSNALGKILLPGEDSNTRTHLLLNGFNTHTKILIYNIQVTKDTSCIKKITPKMNKPIYQESTEKHQAGSLVAEYILNMIIISGSIPPPKNLLNANNKTLRRRTGGGDKKEEKVVEKGRSKGRRHNTTSCILGFTLGFHVHSTMIIHH